MAWESECLGSGSRPCLLCQRARVFSRVRWWGDPSGVVVFSQSQDKGEIPTEIPLPLCPQVGALAGDGVCFEEGAPAPWHRARRACQAVCSWGCCSLEGVPCPDAPKGACEGAQSRLFPLFTFPHGGPGLATIR